MIDVKEIYGIEENGQIQEAKSSILIALKPELLEQNMSKIDTIQYYYTFTSISISEYSYMGIFSEGSARVTIDGQSQLLQLRIVSKEEMKNRIQVFTTAFAQSSMDIYYDLVTGKVIDAAKVKRGVAITGTSGTRIIDWDTNVDEISISPKRPTLSK